ncbi:hypothetical protein BJH93_02935 [Kocuria polaris]|nr:hypothetical protein [Kocuria polaris]
MQLTNVREHNLATVLNTLAAGDSPLSRAALAQTTGLTKPTVSRLVDELLAAGFLLEHAPTRAAGAAGGRPSTPVSIAPASVVGLGASVSADHVAVSMIDLDRRVVASAETPVTRAPTPRDAVVLIADLAAGLLAENPHTRTSGICVSVPGRLSPDGRRIRSAPNLGWDDAPLADLLETAPGLESLDVSIENDARLVAETELVTRRGEGFVLVYGESGIGGAVVVDGAIQRGANGWAGEIGHLCLDVDGPACRCGRRGCLEAYASYWAIAQQSMQAGSGYISEFFAALEGAERDAAIERIGSSLGLALSQVLNIVDLPTVVLGGYFGQLAPDIAPLIDGQLHRHALSIEAGDVRIETTTAAARPSLAGAALRAIQPVFDSPAEWIRRFEG